MLSVVKWRLENIDISVLFVLVVHIFFGIVVFVDNLLDDCF